MMKRVFYMGCLIVLAAMAIAVAPDQSQASQDAAQIEAKRPPHPPVSIIIDMISRNPWSFLAMHKEGMERLRPLAGDWLTVAGWHRRALFGLALTGELLDPLQVSARSSSGLAALELPRPALLPSEITLSPAGPDHHATLAEQNHTLSPAKYPDPFNRLMSLSYSIDVTGSLSLAPTISYYFSVNGDARPELKNATDSSLPYSIIYGGLHFIYSF